MQDETQNAAPAPVSGGPEDQQKTLQQITSMLQQRMQPQSVPDRPRMNPNFGKPSLGADIGMSLLNMFVPAIGGAVQRSVKAQKDKQIYEAVNDYTSLFNAYQDSQIASQGNQEKANQLFMADPRTQAIMGDKKKSKLIAKAFSVDLTNPQKSQDTAHFQGLKRFMDLKQASGQMQQAQGMVNQLRERPQGQPSKADAASANQGDPPSGASAPKGLPTHLQQPGTRELQESASAMKSVIEASVAMEPKTEFQAWYRGYMSDNGGKRPSSEAIEAHHTANKLKPIDQLVQDGIDLEMAGDHAGAVAKFDLAKRATMATAKTPQPTLMGTIFAANAGDKNAKAALETYKRMQLDFREGYGTGRAKWQMIQVMDDEGHVGPMSAYDIRMNQLNGKHYTTVGALPTNDIKIAQRLIAEAGPKGSKFYDSGALKGIYDNLDAYDNASDRAIFARIMSNTPRPQGGIVSDGYAWARNVIDQALKSDSGLSDKGRKLSVNLKRMNETMGVYRALSGLPSTDQSLDISLALMPGATAPDSDFARLQLDSLNTMIENMVNVPIIKPATKTMQGGGANTPTVPGAKKKMNF